MMRSLQGSRSSGGSWISRALLSALAPMIALSLACAGDDGSSTTGETGETSPTTTESTASESGMTESMTTTTTGGETTTTTTTGGVEPPPDYPAPVDGVCPEGTAQDLFGDGQACSPFCSETDMTCPSEGLGDASSSCVGALAEAGGSMIDCSMGAECIPGELCDDMGFCRPVTYWSCLVECGAGGSCPEPMFCSDENKCAYPL